jgi:hypothetical protein
MKAGRHVSTFCHRVSVLSLPSWPSASFEVGRRSSASPLGDLTGVRTESTDTEPISSNWRNDDS